MNWLVADAQDDDRFVFFFSGHGDQTVAVNDRNEADGKDECESSVRSTLNLRKTIPRSKDIIPIDHEDRSRVILDDVSLICHY
jgi:hypothetical protein